MKLWGFVLLFGGFGWILFASVFFNALDISTFSQAYDSLPKQDTFSREEVLNHMVDVFQRLRHSGLWIPIPAFLMLGGGFLLSRPHDHPAIDSSANT